MDLDGVRIGYEKNFLSDTNSSYIENKLPLIKSFKLCSQLVVPTMKKYKSLTDVIFNRNFI